MNPFMYSDFYKTDHRRQYPENTNLVYSNLTPRGSRIPGIDSIVVFGIQYFLKEYLIKQFNQNFFWRPKAVVLAEYKRRLDTSLGKDAVPLDHIEALHDLGYLPLIIKALPEGSLCPMRVACLTIWNTWEDFYWLTNWVETLMSSILWGPMTSATIAYRYRQILEEAAKKTSSIPEFVLWQGHDFSMRGMMGMEGACLSGAGHLLSFTGTDTIAAIDFLEEYYEADADKELIGGSVPATEHSVMSCGGIDTELETFRRLICDVYPKGIVSIVSDTWDFWKVVTEYLPALKEQILKRDGKVVIRPDSGDPVEIILGFPHVAGNSLPSSGKLGAVHRLWNIFGGKTNDKGYRELDPHIGLIYGDSITLDRCAAIVDGLEKLGFASTNIVLGIGSYTYQYNTRDTFGFAIKATYSEIDHKPVDLWKKPATDDGVKFSARGLLCVVREPNGNVVMKEGVGWEMEDEGLLETVFYNGTLINPTTLSKIRNRLWPKE